MPAPHEFLTGDYTRDGFCRSIRDAVEWSGLSEVEIRELIERGLVEWTYHGKSLLISRYSLRLYLDPILAKPDRKKRPRPGRKSR